MLRLSFAQWVDYKKLMNSEWSHCSKEHCTTGSWPAGRLLQLYDRMDLFSRNSGNIKESLAVLFGIPIFPFIVVAEITISGCPCLQPPDQTAEKQSPRGPKTLPGNKSSVEYRRCHRSQKPSPPLFHTLSLLSTGDSWAKVSQGWANF